jgi:dethiobiotin synthetase
VTGTDTGVGKTFVGCALAAAASRRGPVAVFKPAETGCAQIAGELRPDDALRLRAAAASDADPALVCPYRFAEPLAPWVAAERAGVAIEVERLRRCFAELAERAEAIFVESAGGLLVPLGRTYSYADLAADLDLRVVVVVGSRLGALNHTLLTLECAKARRLEVAGYVLNHPWPETDLPRATNAAALERLTEVPCLAEFGHLPEAERLGREELADLGEGLFRRLEPAGPQPRARRSAS